MSLMGTSSILNGCPKKSFSSVYDLRKQFLGHPSHIDNFPIKLTQFCYMYVCVYVRMAGWMDGWMDGWIDGWMD